MNSDGTYAVDFEDGDKDPKVLKDKIRLVEAPADAKPLDSGAGVSIREGSLVEVQIGKKFYPGVVKRVNPDGTYAVDFDDGDKDLRVAKDKIRLAGTSSDSKPPDSGASSTIHEGSRVEVQIGK